MRTQKGEKKASVLENDIKRGNELSLGKSTFAYTSQMR